MCPYRLWVSIPHSAHEPASSPLISSTIENSAAPVSGSALRSSSGSAYGDRAPGSGVHGRRSHYPEARLAEAEAPIGARLRTGQVADRQ